MIEKLLHSHSPLRIFFFSVLATVATLIAVLVGLGPAAFFIAVILIIIEVTFSFENAIINAKVVATLSKFWQQIFLTVGILIAIFGMRIVFPIMIVAVTAQLPWTQVVTLALEQPGLYAEKLEAAHPTIASFGGMFLTMLGLHFFIRRDKKVHWLQPLEARLSKIGVTPIAYVILGILVLLLVWLLPGNPHPRETILAGMAGIVTYLFIHGIAEYFGKSQSLTEGRNKAGLAGFTAFCYLEIIDASFSFDGVIGAFAITNMVVLIAAGLGVGAIWVRSLTVYMVRKGTLDSYRYLEHGAHYTILVLAFVLLADLFVNIPEVVAGAAGIALISASIVSSIRENRKQ